MDSFTLSRNWFNWCFENPEKINQNHISEYKIKNKQNYNKGGFYLITSCDKIYIGKSIDYMARLKSHLYPSNNKTKIDIELNKCSNEFEFYLLAKYSEIGINFFNRKLETIIEQTFIQIALNTGKELLNERIYGHLQII